MVTQYEKSRYQYYIIKIREMSKEEKISFFLDNFLRSFQLRNFCCTDEYFVEIKEKVIVNPYKDEIIEEFIKYSKQKGLDDYLLGKLRVYNDVLVDCIQGNYVKYLPQ